MRQIYTAGLAVIAALTCASCRDNGSGGNPFDESNLVTVFEAGENGCHTYRIPVMVRTHKGTLLAFCEARQNWAADYGDNDIVVKRSTDDGHSWSPMTTIWNHGEDCLANPTPVVLEDGRILLLCKLAIGESYAACTDDLYRLYSDDDGLSWSEPVRIPDSQVTRDGWISYTVGPVHAIQLRHGEHKGRIVIPCYHKWLDEDSVKQGAGHLMYSDDLGQNWTIGALATSGNESTVAELSDGTIIYNMREFTRYDDTPVVCKREVCRSYDGGETLTEVVFDDNLWEPVCQGSLLTYGRDNLLFSNPASFKGRHNLQVKLSRDLGRSWSVVYREPFTFGAYSDMAELSDGSVGIIYECGDHKKYERIVYDIVPKSRLLGHDAIPVPVTVCSSDSEGYRTVRIPALCVAGDGSLLAFYEGRRDSHKDRGDIDLVVKRSTDNGKTWSGPVVVDDNGANSSSSPCPCVLEDGRIVLLYMHIDSTGIDEDDRRYSFHTFVRFSDDNGLSWSGAREISDSLGGPEYYMYSIGPGAMTRLRSGEHRGRIVACGYCKWFDWDDPVQVRQGASFLVWSDDRGETWHKGGLCDEGNEGTVTELSDGKLLLNLRQFTVSGVEPGREYKRIIATSEDGGETLSEGRYEPLLPDPVCNASQIRYMSGESSGEDWLVFCNANSTVGRMNLTVRLSKDCGTTWTAIYREPNTMGGYSSLAQLPDGSIAVLYECGEATMHERIAFDRIPPSRMD